MLPRRLLDRADDWPATPVSDAAFIGRADAPPVPARASTLKYCSVHRATVADDVPLVLVDAVEQASGPGIAIYACQPCVTRHRIVPFADRGTGGLRPVPPRGIQRAP